MSTRSYICMEQEDGTMIGVYCHHDGYPSHNGYILSNFYKERQDVEKLLSMGDMSSLGEIVEYPKTNELGFNVQDHRNICSFYGRDWGESNTQAKKITIRDAKDSWCEYVYLYGLDNKWRYADLYSNKIQWFSIEPMDFVL